MIASKCTQRYAHSHGHYGQQERQPGAGKNLRREQVGHHNVPSVPLIHCNIPGGTERHHNEDDRQSQTDRVPQRDYGDGVIGRSGRLPGIRN
ncbi:hypothetical protein [Arthrobacter sp. 9V]|uniref:hypothetical protein n=1 Tax=Arthrobacter sp. 9V TaxID=2653132 RepID=UPI0019168DAD|nr:hypothetical protein [Arthrobacter sp. 9V]